MILPLAVAYASILLLAFAWAFVELWAKSYDLPTAQRVATAVQVALFAVTAGAISEGAVAAGSGPVSTTRMFAWVALVPPLLVLLWCVYDVDWRCVYVAAIGGSLLPVATSTSVTPSQYTGPVTAALLLAALAARRELRSVRIRRYGRMLEQCSCCGYQQRAVHELCSLGSVGERTIEEYVLRVCREQGPRPWGFIRSADVVREELRREGRCGEE